MISRRSLVSRVLGAGAGLMLPEQAMQYAKAQQPARRMIVDAQVHLWKAEFSRLEMGAGFEATASRTHDHREVGSDDG